MDKTTITTFAAKSLFKLKKYSPEILTGVGVVGVVTAGIFASKATLKLEPIVNETNANLDLVRHKTENKSYESKNDRVRDLTIIYRTAALDLVKLYGPSVSLGLGAIGCILGAHGIMRKRNASLLVAYKTLESVYTKYRGRVQEELGADQERDIYAEIRESEVEDEKGKKKVIAKLGTAGSSMYARFFDEDNDNWEKNPNLSRYFLEAVQQQMNDKLWADGFVFLNDVYKELGIPLAPEGQFVGWILPKDSVIPGEMGDGYIDFGIHEFKNEAKREFILGHENSILLDFNVDGEIWDKI